MAPGGRPRPSTPSVPSGWPARSTTGRLELLRVLEATVEAGPEQERLLEAVAEGGYLRADERPPVPEEVPKPPPKARRSNRPRSTWTADRPAGTRPGSKGARQ